MSKLRNRIRDIGRSSGGFGFAALTQRERRRYMLVVAAAENIDEAEAAARDGADAVVILIDPAHVADAVGRVDVPLGVRLEAATGPDVASAQEAGADFFVFDDGRTHAAALTQEEMGSVLLLGPDQQEDRLRAVAALDLDALIVDVTPGVVTVRDQIDLRRVATLTGAPLLVHCPEDVPDTAALQAWRDAGAALVLVPAAHVERTLAAAAEVPPPTRRRRDRDMPLLGQPPASGHDHDEEDDEE